MHEVWGWEFGDLSTVTVHVRRLRGKIESDPAKPALIRTVWGVGYRFEAEPDAPLPETRPQVPSAVADPPAVNDALATSAQAERQVAAAKVVEAESAAAKVIDVQVVDVQAAVVRGTAGRPSAVREVGSQCTGALQSVGLPVRHAGPQTTGPQASGPQASGPQATGPQSAGTQASGPQTSGPQASGPQTSGPRRAGPWSGGRQQAEADAPQTGRWQDEAGGEGGSGVPGPGPRESALERDSAEVGIRSVGHGREAGAEAAGPAGRGCAASLPGATGLASATALGKGAASDPKAAVIALESALKEGADRG